MTDVEKPAVETLRLWELRTHICREFETLSVSRRLHPRYRGKPGLINGHEGPIHALFVKGIKDGVKDYEGIRNLRVKPVETPEEYKTESYVDGRAYEITAEVRPKYESRGGKPRDVTVLLVFTLNKEGKEVYASETTTRMPDKPELAQEKREIAAEQDASSRRYHEVLAQGLQKPVQGGLPSLGKKRR